MMKKYRTSTFMYQCKNTGLIGNKFPIKNTWELTSERQRVDPTRQRLFSQLLMKAITSMYLRLSFLILLQRKQAYFMEKN